MDNSFKRTLITTVPCKLSENINIGDLAQIYLQADVYRRYLQMNGHDVMLIGGAVTADCGAVLDENESVTTDRLISEKDVTAILRYFGITFDFFTMPTSSRLPSSTEIFFNRLLENHCMVGSSTKRFYDEDGKKYFSERFIYGTCPYCGYERAFVDQCINCGANIGFSDLKTFAHLSVAKHPKYLMPLNGD